MAKALGPRAAAGTGPDIDDAAGPARYARRPAEQLAVPARIPSATV
jgi:hypothetical protein